MPREHRTAARVVYERGNALIEGGGGDLSPTERPVLITALVDSDRFRRDTGLGNIFRPGKISFREVSPVDSLHFVLDGNRVSAHVDDISPLRRRRDGSIGYSVFRILAHNVAGAAAHLDRLLRGTHGQHRCNLECEAVWVDDGDGPDGTVAGGPCGDEPSSAPLTSATSAT